jgi:hypothetical protein
MTQRVWHLPEVWFTAGFVGIVLMLSSLFGLPLNMLSGGQAAFVGLHYLYPLLGVALWGVIASFGQRKHLAKTFLVALPCYAIVLVCHFNLKLWIPHINPTLWDPLYWRVDSALHPVVAACFSIRRAIAPLIPLETNFYLMGFITMFYLSFCIQALRDPHDFRTLFLAALFFQGAGALAYLFMPALGPFIYEQGVEPMQTLAQQGMLADYHSNVAGGARWIAATGATHLTGGLAAMPSLHTGGSFLFLLFAWRYARVLVPLYVILFSFIVIDSIGSRWHYLIDVPVGIVLALCCAWAAERLNPRTGEEPSGARAAGADIFLDFFGVVRRKLAQSRA